MQNTAQKLQVENYALLQQYKETNDVNLRNELVLRYIDIVRYSALAMKNMAAKFGDIDDLINEGVISLMNAIETFDPDKGAKFETYASLKVRGGLIDFVRKQDWVPRHVRKFSKDLDQAFSQLYNDLGRAPSDEELAERLELPKDKLEKLMTQTASAITLSFEELIFEDKLNAMTEDSACYADAPIFEKELKQVIAQAIDTLKEREKQVISLYYYKRLKFSEIAKILGVTESRISQIHTKAILTLKARLEVYYE